MIERRIKSAQTTINIAIILRLLFTAVLMLQLARQYSYANENLFRLYQKSRCLIIIVFGFLLDTILTALWHYRPKLHKLHFWLYFILGGILYTVYGVDLFNASLDDWIVVAVLFTPFIWLIGLIPFIVCIKGNDKLKTAETKFEKQR